MLKACLRENQKFLLIIAVLALIGLSPQSALAQKKVTFSYTLIDLRGFPGSGYPSEGEHLTNRDPVGQVLILGKSQRSSASGAIESHPALWHVSATGNVLTADPVDMGWPQDAIQIWTGGINSSAMAVLRSQKVTVSGTSIFPSYVSLNGLVLLELPRIDSEFTSVTGINNACTIVGSLDTATDHSQGSVIQGAVWQVHSDGTVSGPILLGDFHPYDINNYGVMSGTSGTTGAYPAIGWLQDGRLNLKQIPPASRFIGAGVKSALNDFPLGDARLAVVGNSFYNESGQNNASNSKRGVVWRPYNATRPTSVLGTIGGDVSTAVDINRAEQIVGWSWTKRGNQHACVYANGTITDLNSVTDVGARTLVLAQSINDDGDIVGVMSISNPAEQHGFLLRPMSQ